MGRTCRSANEIELTAAHELWIGSAQDTNMLDLANTPMQCALAGPGSFFNPDFLELSKQGTGMPDAGKRCTGKGG